MKQNRATLYGLPNSSEAYGLRDFLKRSGFPFEWIDLKTDDDARRLAGVTGLNDPRIPVCVMEKGSVLFRPTTRDLATALDWFRGPKHERYDLAIYGAGPAGLSAAVYGASEGLRTIVLERSAVGGQAGSTSWIDNYLGFPDGLSGWELACRARQQAQRLGAEIIVTAEGVGGEPRDDWTVSWLSGGQEIVARATICATGVEYSRLGLVNEENYLGRGLFYGAGSSEASRCTGRVFIVGGGNSAGQAALNFSRFATTVTMLVRGESLKETLSSYLVEQIEDSGNIEALIHTTLVGLDGTDSLESITYRNDKSGEVRHAPTHWVFVCIGGVPRTDWAKPGTLLTDAAGYILTGDDLIDEPLPPSYWASHSRRPMFMETSMPGLFAAGDVRHNSVKRCATAVGDGATAVSMVHRFLALKSRLSLRSATGTSPDRCSGVSGVRESRIAMHETQQRAVDELTNSDGPTFAKLITMAERELGAFIGAVTELFGSEQARLAAEDWLEELVVMEALPGLTSRDWRSITIASSARLANRVNSSPHPVDI